MNENGKATLVGIVSFGFGCANPNYPGVYTKIASFRHWILSKMNHDSNNKRNNKLLDQESKQLKMEDPINGSSLRMPNTKNKHKCFLKQGNISSISFL